MAVNGTGLETRYRQALRDHPSASRITLADGKSVAVSDVYVNRTLLHEVVQKPTERGFDGIGGNGRDATAQEREITVKLPVELWSKLRDERVVLVEGPAGMGKSTLTKHLVQESETHHLIPIWIPFRQFVASGLSILEYFDQHYVPGLELSDLRVPDRTDETGRDHSLGRWCYDQWQSGLGVLILDGLDEVFRHEERVAVLKALPITGSGHTRPATIMTTRPLSQSLPLSMAKVDIQNLTPEEQQKVVERYRGSLQLTEEQITRFTREITKQEQGRLQSLLTRPGHLIEILTAYATTNSILDTETAVLNNVLESRLTITGRSQPSVEEDDLTKKRQVLLSLGLHLLACRQGQRHTRAQLLALIHQVLREHSQTGRPLFLLSQATALLHDFIRNSSLLIEVEPELYEFETVVWLQYLTGAALADEQTCRAFRFTDSHVLDFLDKKAWDPEWELALKSWVGNRENPFSLFTRLMDKQHDDMARHRLGTAGRCLSEVRARQKSQVRYQKLAVRFPREAFALWKANVKQNTTQLMATSLGRAWLETEFGKTKLLALLQSPRFMREAFKALGMLGPVMPVSVQQAIAVWLTDSDVAVRLAATRALAGFGMAMPVSVQKALVVQLEDRDMEVRQVAIRAFERLGVGVAVSVQQALVTWLANWDRSVGVWEDADRALRSLAPAMAVSVQQGLVAGLEDPDGDVCKTAGRALRCLGPAMAISVQQALVALLRDLNVQVRLAACWALRELGPSMAVAVQQALVARLEDPDGGVRQAAIEALQTLRTAMPVVVQEVLLEQLMDPNDGVRRAAALALRGVGVAMAAAVQQALMERLEDPRKEVRRAVAEALGEAAMVVSLQQVLVGLLEDTDKDVREKAIRAFGRLGPVTPVSVQRALVALLRDSDVSVRLAACWALRELGPSMAVAAQQAIETLLDDLDEDVRGFAAWALRKMGATMVVSVQQALVARLADRSRDVRKEAAWTLRGLGPAMSVTVQQALMALLMTEQEWDTAQMAFWALRELGPAMAVPVQQALAVQLANSDENVRRIAAGALEMVGPAMVVAVQQAFISRLADPREEVRRAAAEALSTAQQGLRFFLQGSVLREGRLVSELSATAPFPDLCQGSVMHTSTTLAISAPHRLPLTVV